MQKVWGKLVGGALGFALGGGPIGGLLGLAIGHAYDSRTGLDQNDIWDQGSISPFAGTSQQAAFTRGVIVLGAKMAKADGRVTHAEIETFKRVFQIEPSQEDSIGRLFDRARTSAEGFEPYAFQLAQVFRSHPVVLEQVLSGLILIAAADNAQLSDAEMRFLKRVSFIFSFSPQDLARIAARSGTQLPEREIPDDDGSKIPEPYAILGVRETTTDEAIKAAYRSLIREHHPDKLVAAGMAPEFIAVANEKMKRITVAYDTVCKMRGIK